MKYTRYNIRKKNHKSSIITIILILLIAICGGLLISKVIFQNDSTDNLKKNNGQTVSKDDSDKTVNSQGNIISLVQCGYFGTKDNAVKTQQDIQNAGFFCTLIDDNGKYRAVSFIGKGEEATKLYESLKGKQINSVKMNITIPCNNESNSQMGQIILGYTDLINTTSGQDVQSVKTDKFKKWVSELKSVSDDKKETASLNALKDEISKLPEQLTKNDIGGLYSSINKYLSAYRG